MNPQQQYCLQVPSTKYQVPSTKYQINFKSSLFNIPLIHRISILVSKV